MINLLRGEIYKLCRSKCLYICGITLVVFVLLTYGLFSLTDMMVTGQVENGSMGVNVSVEAEAAEVSIWDEMNIGAIGQMMFGSIGTLIASIFTSIFVFGEYAQGAIKNVVGKGYGRLSVFTSKYLSTIVGTLVLNVCMVITVLLCEVLILGGSRLEGMLPELAAYVGMQLLLSTALTGIVVMISQFCRNLGAGIAVSICLIVFSSFITMALNTLMNFLKIELNVCDYWILDLIGNCPVGAMDTGFLVRALICTAAWFALALVAGGMHFRKVDVK